MGKLLYFYYINSSVFWLYELASRLKQKGHHIADDNFQLIILVWVLLYFDNKRHSDTERNGCHFAVDWVLWVLESLTVPSVIDDYNCAVDWSLLIQPSCHWGNAYFTIIIAITSTVMCPHGDVTWRLKSPVTRILDCLFNSLFRLTAQKTSKLHEYSICSSSLWGNFTVVHVYGLKMVFEKDNKVSRERSMMLFVKTDIQCIAPCDHNSYLQHSNG